VHPDTCSVTRESPKIPFDDPLLGYLRGPSSWQPPANLGSTPAQSADFCILRHLDAFHPSIFSSLQVETHSPGAFSLYRRFFSCAFDVFLFNSPQMVRKLHRCVPAVQPYTGVHSLQRQFVLCDKMILAQPRSIFFIASQSGCLTQSPWFSISRGFFTQSTLRVWKTPCSFSEKSEDATIILSQIQRFFHHSDPIPLLFPYDFVVFFRSEGCPPKPFRWIRELLVGVPSAKFLELSVRCNPFPRFSVAVGFFERL